MPFKSKKSPLNLADKDRKALDEIAGSRTASVRQVERAKVLLWYANGKSMSAIARELRTNRPKVQRTIARALSLGPLSALADLPRSGRPVVIDLDARTWVVALACQKPVDHGYSLETWTTALLAAHIRTTCEQAGHPTLKSIVRGTVSKILKSQKVRPHKIAYYLERRDPHFETKMADVLCVYYDVAPSCDSGETEDFPVIFLSYDEKPGIQGLGSVSPDLPPTAGRHPCNTSDDEYVRHGTVSLLVGIDLLDGTVHGLVEDRHRSREFICFLQQIDSYYKADKKLRIILDNHSSHTSKETMAYLASRPNRFEFVFTPTHGSWLNIIESFFAKMTKTMLRGMQVSSLVELKARLVTYLEEVNQHPVIFRWRYGTEV